MTARPPCTRRAALAPGVLALLPARAAAEASAPSRAAVDAIVRPLMARHDIPGVAVAVTVNGRAAVHDYGVASRQTRAPVTASTLFEIGSVSKMFTATLAALAQAEGRLALEDHPGRHLPRLRGRPVDQATLLHLGTYTAGGLPLQFPDDVHDDDDAALDWLAAWQPDAAPGTVRRYSNPSMGLLGAVAAAAMEERYAALLQTRLLPAFGMRHSHVHVPADAMADYAWGHRDGRQVRVNPGPMADATYGLKVTAGDLIRYVQAQIDPAGLPDPALRSAVAVTQVGRWRVGAMVQGLGWEQLPWPLTRAALLAGHSADVIHEPQPVRPADTAAATTARLYNKTGSTGGFGAYVAFVPARRIGLAMLANRNIPIPARVQAAHAILRQLAPELH